MGSCHSAPTTILSSKKAKINKTVNKLKKQSSRTLNEQQQHQQQQQQQQTTDKQLLQQSQQEQQQLKLDYCETGENKRYVQ